MMTKSQSSKLQGTRELVSVQEMVRRKWPRNKILGAIKAGGGEKDEHAPDDPTLVSYWCRVNTQQVDTSEVRQEAQVRMQAQVDSKTINAITAPPTLDGLATGAAGLTDEQFQELAASIGALVLEYNICCLYSFAVLFAVCG